MYDVGTIHVWYTRAHVKIMNTDGKILLKSSILVHYEKVWVFSKAENLLFPTVLRPMSFGVVFSPKKLSFWKNQLLFFPIPSSNFRNPPNLIWNIDDIICRSSRISSKSSQLALYRFSAMYSNYKLCPPYKNNYARNEIP